MAKHVKKRIKFILAMTLVVVLTLSLAACGGGKKMAQIGSELGLGELDGRTVASGTYRNSTGYRITYTTIEVKGSDVLNTIKESSDWQDMPLSDELNLTVYGMSNGQYVKAPILHDGDDEAIFPVVTEGYYRVIDMDYLETADEEEKSKYDYIFAIYDTEDDKLYYCKFAL
ncbi:MAG: hypothetical protein ACOYCB_09710 [Fastidiosipilaceae bacterium]|nr:hypothetical protein [Clostridiaceae bacterium]